MAKKNELKREVLIHYTPSEELLVITAGNQEYSESFYSVKPEIPYKCDGCDFLDENNCCAIPRDVEDVVGEFCNNRNMIYKRLEIPNK